MNNYSPEVEEAMLNYYQSLSEKDRRLYAAVEAMKIGHGGQVYIAKLFGCSRTTIARGIQEIKIGIETPPERIRKKGGGRKKIVDTTENIDKVFFEVIRDHTAGSPTEKDIKWTNLTLKEIAELMTIQGIEVSEYIVGALLKKHGFVKRQAQKTKTMKESEIRDEQFKRISVLKAEQLDSDNPIISIDTKRKEYIGDFYRAGQLYCKEPIEVYDHDFPSLATGVVIPYGIYDLKKNDCFVSIGTSRDTSEFACDSIRDWWYEIGKHRYPDATNILILADSGGSNSSRYYIFKEELQKLANEIGIELRMAHYPPYTSKYNPIDHRVFCHISRACQGVVFTSVKVVKNLIEKTKTNTGLKVIAKISHKVYETGKKVSESFKKNLPIIADEHLGKLNYCAIPQ